MPLKRVAIRLHSLDMSTYNVVATEMFSLRLYPKRHNNPIEFVMSFTWNFRYTKADIISFNIIIDNTKPFTEWRATFLYIPYHFS